MREQEGRLLLSTELRRHIRLLFNSAASPRACRRSGCCLFFDRDNYADRRSSANFAGKPRHLDHERVLSMKTGICCVPKSGAFQLYNCLILGEWSDLLFLLPHCPNEDRAHNFVHLPPEWTSQRYRRSEHSGELALRRSARTLHGARLPIQ